MLHTTRFQHAFLAAAALSALLGVALAAGPAHAVVICKTVGVPQGCVVSPGPVVAPVVAVGAPLVGVGAPGRYYGRALNRGGPVNRVGRW